MDTAPLAVPATVQRLRALHDAKLLTDTAWERAIAIAAEPPPRDRQASFASRAALILGALLCMASVVFFVAHNWDGLSRWAKFGVLELGLIGFAGAAWSAKKQLTRQIAMTLCAAMIGPLLAVYGQTYQTGADPYELFLTWALLAAPIAALARFMPLWAGVWVLLNVALSLGCEQLRPLGDYPWRYGEVLTGTLNLAGLGIYEVAARRTTWLGARVSWPARALAVAALLPALPLACWYLADVHWFSDSTWGQLSVTAVAAAALVLAIGYRRDRFMKATAAFGVCGMLTALAAQTMGDWLDRGHWAWLLLGVIVVLQVTLAATWIRRTEVRS